MFWNLLFAGCSVFPAALVDDGSFAEIVEPLLEEKQIPGAVIGIVGNGELIVCEAYGFRDLESKTPMTPETLFQVGSVTKTMTATLLAMLVEQGVVAYRDPVTRYLPQQLELAEWWNQVTLEDLVLHRAGLPRNPVNRKDRPESPSPDYALLGQALANAAGEDLEALLKTRLFEPLEMSQSGIHPTPAGEEQLASGYWREDEARTARARWVFGEVAGFAGVFSSVHDMARFAAFSLAEEQGLLSRKTRALLFEPCLETGLRPGLKMARGWFLYPVPGVGTVVGHGGEVDGYSAYLGLFPEYNLGIIVLANLGDRSADELGQAVMERGLPRLLGSDQGPAGPN